MHNNRKPSQTDRIVSFFLFLLFPGSWWTSLSWTWTRSRCGKSRTAAPSTWRKSVLSWPSWRRSDRPSSGRGRRVRTDGASSATMRRITDPRAYRWSMKTKRDHRHTAAACRRCEGIIFPKGWLGWSGAINFLTLSKTEWKDPNMTGQTGSLSVFLPIYLL